MVLVVFSVSNLGAILVPSELTPRQSLWPAETSAGSRRRRSGPRTGLRAALCSGGYWQTEPGAPTGPGVRSAEARPCSPSPGYMVQLAPRGSAEEGGRERIQRKKGEMGGEEEPYDHVIKRSHLYSNQIKASKQTGPYLFVLFVFIRFRLWFARMTAFMNSD